MKKRLLALLLAAGLLAGPLGHTTADAVFNWGEWRDEHGREPTPEEFCLTSNLGVVNSSYYTGIGIKKPEGLPEAAAEAVGSETDTMKKARLLYDWVYTNIIYDMKYNGVDESGRQDRSTTPAFKARRGVCVQKALIFSAMCQSQQIPCYTVHGASTNRYRLPDVAQRRRCLTTLPTARKSLTSRAADMRGACSTPMAHGIGLTRHGEWTAISIRRPRESAWITARRAPMPRPIPAIGRTRIFSTPMRRA